MNGCQGKQGRVQTSAWWEETAPTHLQLSFTAQSKINGTSRYDKKWGKRKVKSVCVCDSFHSFQPVAVKHPFPCLSVRQMCVCVTYQHRELERPCQEPPEGGPAGPCPCSLWSLHGRMSLSTACVCSLLEGKRRKTFTLTSSYISYHQMSIIDPLAARWQTPQVTFRPSGSTWCKSCVFFPSYLNSYSFCSSSLISQSCWGSGVFWVGCIFSSSTSLI